MWNNFSVLMGSKRDTFLVVAMMGVLLMLFVPVPPYLLDFLLITNMSFGLLIFLLTFYSEKPLSFSTFPSLLLIATLFRISLNISATRLILGSGDAGRVINAIGEYVVGGNYVIGFVVFLILVIVQYVVVTNGAQRVAEVAARFTLDSMPGKQMSIDADLNMGLIDDVEAKRRRSEVEREASFYGAMDGATKFVKGDAIAGIIIILIDVIGGLSIGVMQHGMSWAAALHRYTLLTVGDGIVTQIPSLVIAVATGIIITRAATDSQLGTELYRQIASQPKALIIIAAVLGLVVLLPGIPVVPLLILIALLVAFIYVAITHDVDDVASQSEADDPSDDVPQSATPGRHPIELRFGATIWQQLTDQKPFLEEQIRQLRYKHSQQSGLHIQEFIFVEDVLVKPNDYQLYFDGIRVAQGDLYLGQLLAIDPLGTGVELDGTPTREPAYNLPARWINSDLSEIARSKKYTLVNPLTLLVTHLTEVLKTRAHILISRATTQAMVNRLRPQNDSLIDELFPAQLTLSDLQRILVELVKERVSIQRLDRILEVLLDASRTTKDIDMLTVKIREALGPYICQQLTNDDNELSILTLSPKVESDLLGKIKNIGEQSMLVIAPAVMERLIKSLIEQHERMVHKNLPSVIACSAPLRKPLRKLIEKVIPTAVVVSLAEIPDTIKVTSSGTVNLVMESVS